MRASRIVGVALLGLAAGAAALALAAFAWLWQGPGLVSVLQRWPQLVPGLTLEGATGRPTGGAFALQRLRWQGDGVNVVVEGLAWRDAQWRWHPHQGAWVGVRLEGAQAARVAVTRMPTATPPGPRAPPNLRWPFALQAPGLAVGRVEVDTQPPVTGLVADVELGAREGAEHRVQHARAERDGVRFEASATVGTAEPWPLAARLNAAPLNGLWQLRAQAEGPALRPAADLVFEHSSPAPLDAGGWPLRRAEARVRPVDDGQALALERFEVQLTAGTLRGSGRLARDRVTLLLDAEAVEPARLHTRAPALVLGGRATLSATPAGAGWRGGAQLQLQGRLPARGAPPVALRSELAFVLGEGGALQLTVPRAELDAGAAGVLRAEGEAARDTADRWRVRAEGRVSQLDPGAWWPDAAIGPAAGRARVDAGFSVAGTRSPTAGAPFAGLQGRATVTLDERTRWAGLAWRGRATLDAGAALAIDADFAAGDNRVQAQARWPATAAEAPQLTARVQAPRVAALAPLAALLPDTAAAWWPREGALEADVQLQGRWPAATTEGRLRARALRAPAFALAAADATWRVGGPVSADAPLNATLQARALDLGGRRIDTVAGTLAGRWAEHTLALSARSALRPPAWLGAAEGSVASLQARGAWTEADRTWRGRVQRADVRAPQPGIAPWLAAQDVDASVTLAPGGAPVAAALAPGRLSVFGAGLAWQQAAWRAPPGEVPTFALDATLEPMPVAPWLARLQPRFGWQGDLAVAARVALRRGERFDADVQLERSGGDLSLTVEGARRALELSDLRLGLSAHGGRWVATQAVVGRAVGIVGGQQTVTTTPEAAWPGEDAALDGGLSLVVPDLAVWAPWLPPGWRLGGELRAGAGLRGRAGAPDWRGELRAESLAVRQLFEGVHLREGRVVLAMAGDEARIVEGEFTDGPGTGRLRLEGSGRFGEAPGARLTATAEHFRVLDRVDRRVDVSGRAELQLAPQRLALAGALRVDEGRIDYTQADAPAPDADVRVHGRTPLPGEREGPAEPPRAFGGVEVDLGLDLGDALRVRGRGLDTRLTGQLRVTTPGGRLALTGQVRTVDGAYTAYGQNLRIERGTLDFRGEPGNPQLDVLALRADRDRRIGVLVTGAVANPRVRLYSEPALGELETLTWLMLGRAPEGLGRDDTALLQRAALALLAGERDRGPGIVERLGLDELSVRPTGAGEAGSAIVTLGKQVSQRLFVGYEQAVGAAGGSWQLIYRVFGQLTLRARSGAEQAVDAIWTWRWD